MFAAVIQTQLNMQEVQSINVSSKACFIAEIYRCGGDCLLQNNAPSSYHVGNTFFAMCSYEEICLANMFLANIVTVSND